MMARKADWNCAVVTLTAGLMMAACSSSMEHPSNITADPNARASEGSTAKGNSTMVKKALLVQLEAKPEKVGEVATFLEGGLPVVEAEPGTTTWFGIQLGPTTFGIFDAFADDAGRDAHLGGKVAAALMAKAGELLAKPPSIEKVDVIASKLPRAAGDSVKLGLLVPLEAKADKAGDVVSFLESGLPIVEAEPATTAWFAIRRGDSSYAIFDVFPDEAGRSAHLNGKVAAALMAKAPELLSTPPSIGKLDVLAAKLPR
jgi:quinol monooxygenase YgiN